MQSGLSTQLFLPRRVTPALLDALAGVLGGDARAGVRAIEVFAARHHFDYTDAGTVREIAGWFRSHDVAASLHMPLFAEAHWTRHTAPTLNLISPSKSVRIDSMDEVKRALEAAEQIPFRACTLHLGLKDDPWDTRALDDSLTAIEHLKAFAGPLGVQLLLENLPNDVATPEHLVEIVRVGHFDGVGFALDVGHAHLGPSVPETAHSPSRSAVALAFAALGNRVGVVHLHDNHGLRDEHLWPLASPEPGSIDWAEVTELLISLPAATPAFFESAYELAEDPAQIAASVQTAWTRLAGQTA